MLDHNDVKRILQRYIDTGNILAAARVGGYEDLGTYQTAFSQILDDERFSTLDKLSINFDELYYTYDRKTTTVVAQRDVPDNKLVISLNAKDDFMGKMESRTWLILALCFVHGLLSDDSLNCELEISDTLKSFRHTAFAPSQYIMPTPQRFEDERIEMVAVEERIEMVAVEHHYDDEIEVDQSEEDEIEVTAPVQHVVPEKKMEVPFHQKIHVVPTHASSYRREFVRMFDV